MPPREDLTPEAHRRLLAAHGGPAATFVTLVGNCLRGFLARNGRPPLPEALLTAYALRLWTVVTAEGLPRPLAKSESGEPGEMPADHAARLVANVFQGLEFPEGQADLDTATRQLLKACLQPEFRQCRDSYREVVDGACRRQEFDRARGRISGSHCVDCPYWVALQPDQNLELLAKAWVSGHPEELAAHWEVYLPEEFRALKIFLWGQIRAG